MPIGEAFDVHEPLWGNCARGLRAMVQPRSDDGFARAVRRHGSAHRANPIAPKGRKRGHNGIGDIIEALATKAISRLRFGVGHPGADGPPVIDWVLSPFAEEEAEVLRAAVDRAADAVGGVVEGGIVSAMGQFNAQN